MTISTHVLDTAIGRPAAAVPVRLQRREGTTWTEVSQGVTNADGRVPELAPASVSLPPGAYRLLFDVGPYFQQRNADSFYSEIAVAFIVRDAGVHYHIPLLVSPFGYTTYRGS